MSGDRSLGMSESLTKARQACKPSMEAASRGTVRLPAMLTAVMAALGVMRGEVAVEQVVFQGYRWVLGDRHPSTLNCLNNLAVRLKKDGNLEEGERACDTHPMAIARASKATALAGHVLYRRP